MRAVVQRVSKAEVSIHNDVVGSIGQGLLIFLGVGHGDNERTAVMLADKIVDMRIFEDEERKMNRSLAEIVGSALIVSQFTLYADTKKGRRPSFTQAAPIDLAMKLYERFIQAVSQHGLQVESGKFQADMAVSLVNDGPVTILLDTATM